MRNYRVLRSTSSFQRVHTNPPKFGVRRHIPVGSKTAGRAVSGCRTCSPPISAPTWQNLRFTDSLRSACTLFACATPSTSRRQAFSTTFLWTQSATTVQDETVTFGALQHLQSFCVPDYGQQSTFAPSVSTAHITLMNMTCATSMTRLFVLLLSSAFAASARHVPLQAQQLQQGELNNTACCLCEARALTGLYSAHVLHCCPLHNLVGRKLMSTCRVALCTACIMHQDMHMPVYGHCNPLSP